MIAILWGGLIALVGALVGTHYLIGYLLRHHYGQYVRDEMPSAHLAKRGTPTMGGLAIILAVLLAYTGAHLITWQPPSASALLVLGVFVATGFVGLLDDWAKIKQERSLGLSPRAKLIGQVIIGVAFGVLALRFPDSRGVTPATPDVSFTGNFNWDTLRLPLVIGVIWMTFLITGFSNAVNLTDGLDGLATGSSAMVFVAYGLMNVWERNQSCDYTAIAGCYQVRDPVDLAMVSVTLAAACFGFLWWNAKPARIYLGDTGSLALGATMGGLAICTRTELLLVVLGALFVIETASVAIQIGWFKVSHGKRVFKMAPLHHHFEMAGWEEQTVVVRFWLLCGISVCVGIGIFYSIWVILSRTGG